MSAQPYYPGGAADGASAAADGASAAADGGGRSSPVFTCGDNGPVIMSFGMPPPQGVICMWQPTAQPPCLRPIPVTNGLAIGFKVRQDTYVAWTTVGKDTRSNSIIMWSISKECASNDALVLSEGPGPNKAVVQLLKSLHVKLGNFGIRKRLGFSNVVMLAQLERAFNNGTLPSLWVPCVNVLKDGRMTSAYARLLHETDENLQRDLAHLVPETPALTTRTSMSTSTCATRLACSINIVAWKEMHCKDLMQIRAL